MFSGPDEGDTGLPAALRRRGWLVDAIDTKVGGRAHDLTQTALRNRLVAAVAGGQYEALYAGTPCKSYSVAHSPQLRSRRWPEGLPNAPPEWRDYLERHNGFAALTAALVRAAHQAGVPWAVENPVDRADEAGRGRWYWPSKADHAPLWRMPCMRAALELTGARTATFPQCALGAAVQKYTTLAFSPSLETSLGALRGLACGHAEHAQVAYGRDARGQSRAEAAAAYPQPMCEAIATGLVAAGTSGASGGGDKSGGSVADGWALCPTARRACDAARLAPPPFASLRNTIAASAEELELEPMPTSLGARPASAKPRGKPKGRPLPAPATGGEAACDAATVRPPGKITIWMLYGEGVYQSEVLEGWMPLARAAAVAIARGETPPAVPTLRIPAARQPAWARGKVWDTRDPYDCHEVERSTRDTVFPGKRQVDRAKLRAIAAELGWHDRDMMAQVGEGGAESRSTAPLESVFSFHHQGVATNFAAVQKVVAAGQAEEWVTGLFAHPPMVPPRLVPRNVVMQERMRVAADGSLESYLKPRVTANESEGAEESLNAGIPQAEISVGLPTVQRLGRALAIIDGAARGGDESARPAAGRKRARDDTDAARAPDASGAAASSSERVRAAGYAVDLESAYSFVPVQRAEWHQQIFVWWEVLVEPDGTISVRIGFCMEMRLMFGGAFAPNRFERLTTMVGAWIVKQQRAFDAAHPYPPNIEAWGRRRRALQQAGALPADEGQGHPAYLQVYLDDYNGGATDDQVGTPPELAAITLPTAPTVQGGGVPASPGTRVYVHAQIVVASVRTVGFSDSEQKTCIGTPFGSLGFDMDIDRGRIRCPARKRTTMLADVREQAARARDELTVLVEPARRLVGRLANLSQIYPELKRYMHGGHTVTPSGRTGRWQPRHITLRPQRAAQVGWLQLLTEAELLLDENHGVPLAPKLLPPDRSAAGVWTSVTDASGVDGLGGYVFKPERPGEVWIVSERWPSDVLAALARAASRGAERESARRSMEPMLSTPAAELLTQWMAPTAAAEADGAGAPSAVYAVGDCQPATAALNSATGGNEQMRAALQGARRLCEQWVAAHVRRDFNKDADRLSHPALAAQVAAAAAAAGLIVHEARILPDSPMWEDVRRAAAAGAGGGPAIGIVETARSQRRARAARERAERT